MTAATAEMEPEVLATEPTGVATPAGWRPYGSWGLPEGAPLFLTRAKDGELRLTLRFASRDLAALRPDPSLVQNRQEELARESLPDCPEFAACREVTRQFDDALARQAAAAEDLSGKVARREAVLTALPADLADRMALAESEVAGARAALDAWRQRVATLRPLHAETLKALRLRLDRLEADTRAAVYAELQAALEGRLRAFMDASAEELQALTRLSLLRAARPTLAAFAAKLLSGGE